jgi:hypothetical protein
MSGVLRSNPRREFNAPGTQRFYRQDLLCRKCKQYKGLAGCSRVGGFTCKECKEAA